MGQVERRAGAKRGAELPDYPGFLTHPADKKRTLNDPAYGPNCKQALGDLADADLFATLINGDAVQAAPRANPSDYALEMRCLSNEAWHFGYPRNWEPMVLTSSARTSHSNISRRRFSETEPGSVEPISRFYKLSPTGLSNTLRAGTDGARGAFTSPRPIHYEHARCVTVREMARLHGFPDWFRFHVTKWHGARQIGNAVPPPLARAVATSVIQALGVLPKRVVNGIDLGDEQLLEFELSSASDFFGVEKPASKRDRKSGAKKRKQNEIEEERNYRRVANG